MNKRDANELESLGFLDEADEMRADKARRDADRFRAPLEPYANFLERQKKQQEKLKTNHET